MNNNLYLTFLFISLILLQVLILNNILLFGYVNPYLYVAFVAVFPFGGNRFLFLTYSFLLGLAVDFFTNSGGAHAFATVSIAYFRLYFFKKLFQKPEAEHELFKLKQETFGKRFNFITLLVFTHHFILFFLINFSFNNLLNIFTNTLLSGIFTLFLYFLGSFIFSRK